MSDLIIKPSGTSANFKVQNPSGTDKIVMNSSGTITTGTLGSGVTFPAGHIIQVKFVEFTGIQTICDGTIDGKTFVNIGTGVSGQEFSIDMSVSRGNQVLGFCNVNISATGRYSGIKVFYDSTQIALGDAAGSRSRMTVSAMRNDEATNDTFIMHNSSFVFNYTPSDTSSHTYKVQAGNTYSASTYTYVNRNNNDTSSHTYSHRGYSHFMLMEIAQ